jgi:hypothetical protein
MAGKVTISKGTAAIAAPLVIAKNAVTLEGQGMYATILLLNASVNGNVITINAAPTQTESWYLKFKDFKIDGLKASQSAGHGIAGLCYRSVFENLYIKSCKNDGIRLGNGSVNCWTNQVNHCFLDYNDGYGLNNTIGASDTMITDTECFTDGLSGMLIDDSGVQINHVHISGCLQHGIELAQNAAIARLMIHNSYIESNVMNGIDIDVFGVYGMSMVGCTLWNALTGYSNFYVHLADWIELQNSVILGNLFDGNDASAYNIDIATASSHSYNRFVGNIFKSAATADKHEIDVGTDNVWVGNKPSTVDSYCDNTAGGTNGLTTRAPSSDVLFDALALKMATADDAAAAVAAVAAAGVYLPLAGGTMTGDITLSENVAIILDPALSADEKYSGIIEVGTAGCTTNFGDLLYLAVADSRWELTDANASATAKCKLGINVSTAQKADGDSFNVLLWGKVRSDADYAFTVAAPVFISETAGDMTSTAPSTSAACVRIVGYGNTADELFFCPSNDWMELA